MTTTIATLDVAAYAAAIENRDVDGQLAAFADDAELVVIDHDHPPTTPTVIRGRDALRAHIGDIASRDMTHRVTTAALAGDRLTIELACEYPDGTKVACLCVCGVVGGRIAWQRGLQVWDS